MLKSLRSIVLVLASLAVLPSCDCSDDCEIVLPPPQLVGLTVEVRDGSTGLLLEGARVLLVSVTHEWSGCVCQSPFTVDGFTNQQGRVRISAHEFADAEIGFREDGFGNAILLHDSDQDEARVTLDIDGAQFGSAQVSIQLDWHHADRLLIVEL
jgi:hypothetical protein